MKAVRPLFERLLPWAVFGIALNLYLWRIDLMRFPYFDEIRYISAARQFFAHGLNENAAHPPLGKGLIALSIQLFGDSPLGWRLGGVLFGAAIVSVFYLVARRLFQGKRTALEVAALALANPMLYVQSRVATLDVFMMGFLSLALWAMVVRPRASLVKFAVFSALAIAVNWAAIVPVSALILAAWLTGAFVGTPPRRILALFALALAAYLASFSPLLGMKPPTGGTYSAFDLVSPQLLILKKQLAFDVIHPDRSPWFEWPLGIHPTWFAAYAGINSEGHWRAAILSMGNPLLLWSGLLSAIACAWLAWRERTRAAVIVAALYFGTLFGWAFVPRRILFNYYYFPCTMWLTLAVPAVFERLRLRALFRNAFVLTALGLSAFLLPLLNGTELADASFTRRLWLPSWEDRDRRELGESCSIILAGRIFDGSSERPSGPGTIVVRGTRITEVGGPVKTLPQGCEVIDWSPFTVMPGLIDAHTHLLLTDLSHGADFSRELKRVAKESDAERLKMARRYAAQLIASGITTIRDLGNAGNGLDLKLRAEIAAGETLGPRMLISGRGIAPGTAQFPAGTPEATVSREYFPIHSEDEIPGIVGALVKSGVDWVKVYADNEPGPERMPERWLVAITRESHRRGLRVAAHAVYASSVLAAARAGVDSLEHVPTRLNDETLSLLKDFRGTIVPTDPSRRIADVCSRHGVKLALPELGRLRRALDRGVSIAFGSDLYLDLESDGLDRGQSSKETLYAYVEEQGLTPLEALRAATRGSARLLHQSELGEIAPGMIADLIAVDGNPLENIRSLEKVSHVLQHGQRAVR